MGELNWDASERPELGPCDGQFFEDPDELAMKTAIRLSLEASQETNNTDKPTDLPERKFKVEEIEEDEKRQVWELYGPPTPPLRPRQVDAMKSSKQRSANTVPTAGTNNKPSGKGGGKHSQKAATVDDPNADQPGTFIPKAVIDKLPAHVWSAVADAVAYHKQLSSEQSVGGGVDVTVGYNNSSNSSNNKVGCRTPLPSAPATNGLAFRGSGCATKKTPLDYFRLGGLDGAAAPRPNHVGRMAVIRAALDDPGSSLSVAVREESQFVRGGKAQRRPSEPSAGPQPGSERAAPAHEKNPRD